MCLYVLSSMLWFPLRLPYETMFGSSLQSSCFYEGSIHMYVVCVSLCTVVANTYCVGVLFFVLCTLCCQFLKIVHFYFPFGTLLRLSILLKSCIILTMKLDSVKYKQIVQAKRHKIFESDRRF